MILQTLFSEIQDILTGFVFKSLLHTFPGFCQNLSHSGNMEIIFKMSQKPFCSIFLTREKLNLKLKTQL